MATTTNYGWTTPDDTALVKDGAAAIRSLGTSIDTTLKTQIDAQIPDSLLTTKGDIIAATGASTPARLGVGSNDQILVADSTTATGLKWLTPAGGAENWSLLNAGGTALTAASTITVSGISGKNQIMIVIYGASSASAYSNITLRLNADSGSNYRYTGWEYYGNPTLIQSVKSTGTTSIPLVQLANAASDLGYSSIFIKGCNTAGLKPFQVQSSNDEIENNHRPKQIAGTYSGTSTISSVSVISGTGNFDAGTIFVYATA
jgi:hypothetical protein